MCRRREIEWRRPVQHTIRTLPADQGEILWVLGDRLRLLGELPGTGLHVAHLSVPPGSGPPLHTHPSPELFHITSGELAFHTVEDGRSRTIIARPGDTIAVPPGTLHGFRNEAGAEAHALVWLDEHLLAFFREVGSASPPAGPPTPSEIRRVVEIARQHGMTIVGPAADS